MSAIADALICQRMAVDGGFDWRDADETVDKLQEEMNEFKNGGADARMEEAGDILFTAVSLARTAGIHPERALLNANQKFHRRWEAMEKLAAAQGQRIAALPLDEKKALWRQAKRATTAPTDCGSG